MIEELKNKTCGECKYFQVVCDFVTPSTNAAGCDGFKKKARTNGDKIRQLSDEELASIFALSFMCDTCPLKDVECIGDGETERTYAHCYDKLFSYLNAPAESEVEDER